jgi:transposase
VWTTKSVVVRLKTEKDIEIVRTAAALLERENQRLTEKVVSLTRELLALKGEDPAKLQLRLAQLEEQLAQTKKKIFGRSSEKQPKAKDEPEPAAKPQTGHGPHAQTELPEIEVVHSLDEADKVCSACGGALTEWEGQFEESREIDVIERRFVVKKHKQKKYVCTCGACIETALGPEKLFSGARYSIDFAVEIAGAKYLDHAPLERQVRIMRREGLVVESQTLWDQIERLARPLAPVAARIHAHVLSQAVIGADETHWRLMGATGKDEGEAKRWQIWIARASDSVFYSLEDSRSVDAAGRLLDGYEGIVMCDGYRAYSALQKRGGRFRLAHCWAHVRRKYVEIQDFFPTQCREVLGLIGELYAAESACPTGPPGEDLRRSLREQRSRDIVRRIEQWALRTPTTRESGLGKAVAYMTGIWSGLIRFLDDPRIPLDNNGTERAARGPVIGRKNHYGSRSRRGTEVAALFYTLLESAKLAGVEPKTYLRLAIRTALRGDPVPLPHECAAATVDA